MEVINARPKYVTDDGDMTPNADGFDIRPYKEKKFYRAIMVASVVLLMVIAGCLTFILTKATNNRTESSPSSEATSFRIYAEQDPTKGIHVEKGVLPASVIAEAVEATVGVMEDTIKDAIEDARGDAVQEASPEAPGVIDIGVLQDAMKDALNAALNDVIEEAVRIVVDTIEAVDAGCELNNGKNGLWFTNEYKPSFVGTVTSKDECAEQCATYGIAGVCGYKSDYKECYWAADAALGDWRALASDMYRRPNKNLYAGFCRDAVKLVETSRDVITYKAVNSGVCTDEAGCEPITDDFETCKAAATAVGWSVSQNLGAYTNGKQLNGCFMDARSRLRMNTAGSPTGNCNTYKCACACTA